MEDNTTLYIIIGVALLLAFMNANSQQSNTGGPARSAYLRRRATMPPAFIEVPTMPEFIETGVPTMPQFIDTGVPTMPQVLEPRLKQQYIRAKHATLPQYVDLGARPQSQYLKPEKQGNPLFN